MKLVYKNLSIRPAAIEDAKQLVIWWNDGQVMAHAGFPNGLHTNEEEVKEKLKENQEGNILRMMLEADDVCIGEMIYRRLDHETVDIGIKICEENYQDQGLGRIYLRMLMKHLFFDLKFQKIVLSTDLENTRAQHVYELLGFQKVRMVPNAWENQISEWRTTMEYECNVDSWGSLSGEDLI